MDEVFMMAALSLARAQLGRVAPNPAVGCVIVAQGQILAQAATGDGGRPHAEEDALRLAGPAAAGADIYVSLEPCARRSTGAMSCADRIIAARPARLIVAARDPHPNAAGAGLARIEAAGIPIVFGVCEAEAVALNAGFFMLATSGQPLLAISADSAQFDAQFEPLPDETIEAALARYGQMGLTRVFTPPGSALAEVLIQMGLAKAPD